MKISPFDKIDIISSRSDNAKVQVRFLDFSVSTVTVKEAKRFVNRYDKFSKLGDINEYLHNYEVFKKFINLPLEAEYVPKVSKFLVTDTVEHYQVI